MFKKCFCVFLAALLLLPACGKVKKTEEGSAEETPAGEVTGQETVFTGNLETYQQTFVADIVREVAPEDRVRNKSYTVDDEKLESLIDMLDFALNSNEVKSLLGMDLGAVIRDLTKYIYTDSIVNLAVGALYPLVEKEFAKVWADLPESLELTDVETGVAVAPKANVNATLHIDTIEDALESIQFYLFPTKLADHLPPEFAEAAAKLRLATTPSAYNKETDTMTTPWLDAAILDAEGNLDIPWGVHDRESFIAAMSAALSGVEPLLLALLANKACDNRGIIGTGDGHAAVAGGAVKLDMQITSIELVLTATANSGYDNALVPIFEALGVPATEGDAFASTRDLIEHGLVEPVEAALNLLAAAPVRFVLSALPNLAYAVEAQMIVPLLSMLKTEINYTTNAKYTVKLAGDGEMNDAYKSDEPIKINVGEMIDLNSLGIDLSSLNGLLALAEGPLGFKLPQLDGRGLATLGTLTWRDTLRKERTYTGGEAGKAAYIHANCADVLMFLLDYVLGALKDRTTLDALLTKLGGNAALPELVYSLIDRVTANAHGAVAALTELILPQHYDEPNSVKWHEPTAPVNGAAALYNDYWTHDKADYMQANLPGLIDNVLATADLNIAGISAKSLPGLLDGLVGAVCKASLLNTLAEKVRGVLSGISLPDAVNGFLKEKLGLDIHYWEAYHADFADGDREAFKLAVSNLLYPVQKVVTFLLSDEDITVNLTGADGSVRKFLHLHGFDAYSQAIIPLLEALGAQNLPSPQQFKSSPEAAFISILDAVFGVIDGLKSDPYHKITVLLPNLLCFIKFGGLTSVMDNLLYSVNLVLDIIRPIYDVDLYSLVDFDLRFEKTDPIPLVMDLLSGVLKKELGVDIKFSFTTDTLFNALNTGTVETFTSANGQTSYRVNEASINKADMLTVVYDYLLTELLFSANTQTYLAFAKDKLSLDDRVYGYVEKILPALKDSDAQYPGSGKALIFWVFFAAEAVVGAAGQNGGTDDILGLITTLMGSGNEAKREFAKTELRADLGKEGISGTLGNILKALFQ